jgi:hypothetical protein
MYQPGGSIIVCVSIIVDVSFMVYESIIVDVDIYTKINPPD